MTVGARPALTAWVRARTALRPLALLAKRGMGLKSSLQQSVRGGLLVEFEADLREILLNHVVQLGLRGLVPLFPRKFQDVARSRNRNARHHRKPGPAALYRRTSGFKHGRQSGCRDEQRTPVIPPFMWTRIFWTACRIPVRLFDYMVMAGQSACPTIAKGETIMKLLAAGQLPVDYDATLDREEMARDIHALN
jgi:hypothetical protein